MDQLEKAKRKIEIITKPFLSKEDFYILFEGHSEYLIRKLFQDMKERAASRTRLELAKSYIPTELIKEDLKVYGISQEQLIQNYEMLKKLK